MYKHISYQSLQQSLLQQIQLIYLFQKVRSYTNVQSALKFYTTFIGPKFTIILLMYQQPSQLN